MEFNVIIKPEAEKELIETLKWYDFKKDKYRCSTVSRDFKNYRSH